MNDRDLDGHVWAEVPLPCWHCGTPTHFVEISFEAPLCPGSCTEAKWDEYVAAQRRLGPPSSW